MQRMLIGIGGAVVLAGAIFAVLHFSAGGGQAGSTAQNGWVPVRFAASPNNGPVRVAGSFGAWRLLCRSGGQGQANAPTINNVVQDAKPGPGSCAVALLMRKLNAPKEWLNLRVQTVGTGSDAVLTIAYSSPQVARRFRATPGASGIEVDVTADQDKITLWIQRCIRGICFARTDITSSDLKSVGAARNLVALLTPPGSGRVEVHLPAEGLKAAFAALQQQT